MYQKASDSIGILVNGWLMGTLGVEEITFGLALAPLDALLIACGNVFSALGTLSGSASGFWKLFRVARVPLGALSGSASGPWKLFRVAKVPLGALSGSASSPWKLFRAAMPPPEALSGPALVFGMLC